MLEVRDITVRAGSRTLLAGVSFAADPGEIVGVIGPNGAGKTTLLEVLVGLRRASSAVVTFRGVSLATFATGHAHSPFYRMPRSSPRSSTCEAVVAHALQFRPRAAALVDELRNASCRGTVRASTGVLSRGEQQRVALFCALAVDRPVVVLDEPFNAFDPCSCATCSRPCAASPRPAPRSSRPCISSATLRRSPIVSSSSQTASVSPGNLDSLREQVNQPGADLKRCSSRCSNGGHVRRARRRARSRVTWLVAATSGLLVGHGFVLAVDLYTASSRSALANAPSGVRWILLAGIVRPTLGGLETSDHAVRAAGRNASFPSRRNGGLSGQLACSKARRIASS
jgi:ABC-type transport system involved in cytochrome c biogenesis ATPase subunit